MIWYATTARELYTATADKDLAALTAAHELEIALLSQKGFATYYYLNQDREWLTKLDESRRAFDLWLERARQVIDEPEAVALLDQVASAYGRYTTAKDAVIALYRQGRADTARQQHWGVREDFEDIQGLCQRFKEFFRARMRHTSQVYLERADLVMEVSTSIIKNRKKLLMLLVLLLPIIAVSFVEASDYIGGKHAYAPAFYTSTIFLVSVAVGLAAGLITGCIGAGGGFIITPALMAGSWPKAMPPALTLGQEMLTSRAATPGTPASRPASSANSSASQA